ncbi:MAG: hypothetical protein ABIJ34_04780, partial [archaeon]
WKLALLFIIVLLFSKYKIVIFLLAFELSDIFKISLKRRQADMALDLVFIFGITAAFYYNFFTSIQVFFLGIINRVIMSTIQVRHIVKIGRHIPLFLIASFLKMYSFFYIALILLVFNYVVKYAIETFIEGCPRFDKIHYHATNFCVSIILFYIIGLLYSLFPFFR